MLAGYPRELTWVDFDERAVSPNPPFAALTDTAWSWSADIPPRADANGRWSLLNVRVTVDLRSMGSWVVTGQKTDALLRHEQGHFDITGLLARDFHSDVTALAETSRAALNTRRGQLVDALRRDINRVQGFRDQRTGLRVEGLYDHETEHGVNILAQNKWNDIFRRARERGERFWASINYFNYIEPLEHRVGDQVLMRPLE